MELSELVPLTIFRHLSPEEIREAMETLKGRIEQFPKNQIVIHAGDLDPELCVVLQGQVNLEIGDYSGSRIILSHIGPDQAFGLSRITPDLPMLVNAVSATESTVLFLDLRYLRGSREHDQPWLRQILVNLLGIANGKSQSLAMRSIHVSPKKAQDRLLSFLNAVAADLGTREFTIPFDQQQLADYLNLDRSVVSKELNRLKREGRLWFNRRMFILPPIEKAPEA